MASLTFLEDWWDDSIAKTLDEPDLLRYRSNPVDGGLVEAYLR